MSRGCWIMSQGHRECQHRRGGTLGLHRRDFRRKRVRVVVIKLLRGESIDNLIRIGYRMWWADKDERLKDSEGRIKAYHDKDRGSKSWWWILVSQHCGKKGQEDKHIIAEAFNVNSGASLVAQWRRRVCLPVQEPWGLTPDPQRPPMPQGDWAHGPHLLSSRATLNEAHVPFNRRSRCSNTLVHCN